MKRIAVALRDVFFSDTRHNSMVPTTQLITHPSGLCLRLSGWVLEGEANRTLISVLVEEVVSRSVKMKSLQLFYGLSEREIQLVDAITHNEGPKSTASRLGVSVHTVRTLKERALIKMEVQTTDSIKELLVKFPMSLRSKR